MSNQSPDDADDVKVALANAFEKPEKGAARFEEEVDLNQAGIDLADTTLEDNLLKADAERDGVQVPELPEGGSVSPNPAFETDPVADAKATVDDAFKVDFDFSTVEVTAKERDMFVRSGLHDEPMHYDIEVPGVGITVRVAMLPESYTEAVMAALNDWQEAGHITGGNISWLLGFQLMHLWMQVRTIDGKPTDWIDAEGRLEKITYRELRALLANPDTVEPLRKMNPVRWNVIRLAVRIAEHKQKICLEKVLDRTFFQSEGTA